MTQIKKEHVNFTKYPHIDSLEKVQDIFLEPEVICTEKIHGTNVRVGWLNGKIRIGGRNIEHTNDGDNSIMGFTGWVRNSGLAERMRENLDPEDNLIYYGEWFGPGIQKGINYGNEKQFRVFDVRFNGDLCDWDLVKLLADKIDLLTVPELYRGIPKLEKFDELIKYQSEIGKQNGVVGDNLHEGIVIKPTRMKKLNATWLIAKYKHAKWSERKSQKENKRFNMSKEDANKINKFVEEFVTKERLLHVLDHLRDREIDITDLKSIPSIIKEMNFDILREGKEEIAKITEDENIKWNQLSKVISKRTVEMFKKHLYEEMRKNQGA